MNGDTKVTKIHVLKSSLSPICMNGATSSKINNNNICNNINNSSSLNANKSSEHINGKLFFFLINNNLLFLIFLPSYFLLLYNFSPFIRFRLVFNWLEFLFDLIFFAFSKKNQKKKNKLKWKIKKNNKISVLCSKFEMQHNFHFDFFFLLNFAALFFSLRLNWKCTREKAKNESIY